jgi:hypothetical protein
MSKFVIYGFGNCAQLVKWTLLRAGHIVIELAEETRLVGKGEQISVIVAIFNAHRYANYPAIRKSLLKRGFKSIISFEEFYQQFYKYLPKYYFWLSKSSFYRDKSKKILKVNSLWSDEKSRELFSGLMRHRINLSNFHCLLGPDSQKLQYFPKDIPIDYSSIHTLVDGGAYTGDTIRKFLRHKIPLQNIIAFEPGRKNWTMLCNSALSNKQDRINFIEQGAGSRCGQGRNKVNTMALDKFSLKPDYIKLDVEGYEKQALMGMKNIILKHHPVLAVAVYHKPEDLFEIPLLIHSWDKQAKFYLRVYGEHCLEVILYVVWGK